MTSGCSLTTWTVKTRGWGTQKGSALCKYTDSLCSTTDSLTASCYHYPKAAADPGREQKCLQWLQGPVMKTGARFRVLFWEQQRSLSSLSPYGSTFESEMGGITRGPDLRCKPCLKLRLLRQFIKSQNSLKESVPARNCELRLENQTTNKITANKMTSTKTGQYTKYCRALGEAELPWLG